LVASAAVPAQRDLPHWRRALGSRLGLLIGLVPFLALAAWQWDWPSRVDSGDHAHYFLHARALLEGKPYAETGFIYTKYNAYIGPEAEPPGMPLLILPIFALLGPNPHALKLLVVLSGALTLALAWLYLRRDDPLLAFGMLVFAGVSLQLARASVAVLADLPFAACVWGVVLLCDAPAEGRAGRWLAVAALGIAALSFRIAAVPLIPALVLVALLRRAFKPAPYAVALLWGGCFLALDALLPMTSAVGSQFSPDAGRWIQHLTVNLRTYVYGLGQSLLYPFPWNRANDAYHLLAAGVAALGLLAWLRPRPFRVLMGFVLAYGAMLLLIPTRAERYLWVLYPLVGYALLAGLRALLGLRLDAARSGAWAVAVGCLLAATAIATALRVPRDPGLEENPDVQELFGRLADVASQEPVRALFFKPRTLTWLTRIPAMGPFVAPPELVLDELDRQHITHVVLGDLGVNPERQASMRGALESEPASLRLYFENRSFRLYAFARHRGTEAPAGS
jgi:hypothetical protein